VSTQATRASPGRCGRRFARRERADLAPLEVAAGVAAAIASGAAPDDVARRLGWNRRQLNRYLQLHDAPAWLKDFSREVKAAKSRRDKHGAVVIDEVTQRPVVDVVTHAGLAFSHVFELVTVYNVLRQVDAERLAVGGDGFRPQAERMARKLAANAAAEGWASRSCARRSNERSNPSATATPRPAGRRRPRSPS
jgi:hypothetical protein